MFKPANEKVFIAHYSAVADFRQLARKWFVTEHIIHSIKILRMGTVCLCLLAAIKYVFWSVIASAHHGQKLFWILLAIGSCHRSCSKPCHQHVMPCTAPGIGSSRFRSKVKRHIFGLLSKPIFDVRYTLFHR